MKSVTRFLVTLFGTRIYGFYLGFRANYFPSRLQIEAKIREKGKTHQLQLFLSNFVQKGSLCFDVGANMGNRIQPLLNLGGKVVAVEPQEKCTNHLKNVYGDKIIIIEKGLGSKEELKDFYLSDLSDTLSTFSEEWMHKVSKERFRGYLWRKKKKVPMTTLDALVAEFGIPEFIKIDVEGYEKEVLNGLSSKVSCLSFEYTVPELTDNLSDCLLRIKELSRDAKCNYSIGESFELFFIDWISISDFISYIRREEFIKTSLGDIYVKFE